MDNAYNLNYTLFVSRDADGKFTQKISDSRGLLKSSWYYNGTTPVITLYDYDEYGNLVKTRLTISGDFSVVALKNAVDEISAEVGKLGFKILVHVPSLLVAAELINTSSELPCVYTNCDGGFARLLLSSSGKIVAAYKVVGDDVNRLKRFVCERFFLKNVAEEPFSMQPEMFAKIVAEDAWVFRTDGVPAFHSAVDKDAIRRIREAAFSRRVLKNGFVFSVDFDCVSCRDDCVYGTLGIKKSWDLRLMFKSKRSFRLFLKDLKTKGQSQNLSCCIVAMLQLR